MSTDNLQPPKDNVTTVLHEPQYTLATVYAMNNLTFLVDINGVDIYMLLYPFESRSRYYCCKPNRNKRLHGWWYDPLLSTSGKHVAVLQYIKAHNLLNT